MTNKIDIDPLTGSPIITSIPSTFPQNNSIPIQNNSIPVKEVTPIKSTGSVPSITQPIIQTQIKSQNKYNPINPKQGHDLNVTQITSIKSILRDGGMDSQQLDKSVVRLKDLFKGTLLILLMSVGLSTNLMAQQAMPTDKLQFDQAAPDLNTANTVFEYAYYEGTVRTVISGVVCTGTVSPFTCTVNFPAFTPGTHTISAATAVKGSSPLVESPKSTPLTFTFILVPSTPANFVIIHF